MSGPQNKAGIRMPGDGLQHLIRLLYRQPGVLLQQSCSMLQRNIHCPNGLRDAVQLNIQSIPVVRYHLMRVSRARFVKSATGVLDLRLPELAVRFAREHHPYRARQCS